VQFSFVREYTQGDLASHLTEILGGGDSSASPKFHCIISILVFSPNEEA
jgi:hypothetical protein